jgi:predicted DCC family thiol-disulfide oxidoreductase YuxK
MHSSNPACPVAVDTLFYDGQCPLCASEIEQLREARGDALALVDIHDLALQSTRDKPLNPDSADRSDEPSKDDLLRVLHLRRADGSWLTSADANVAAWESTRHGRLLRVLRWPVLRHAVDMVYALWARWRYRRLYGAQFEERSHAPRS